MKKLLLASCLLLAACKPEVPAKWEPRDQCHLDLEAIGYSQVGYFEGQEAYKFLSPINIWLDHRQEKTINLDVFSLWWNKDLGQFLIDTGCRVISDIPADIVAKALEYKL